MSIKSYTVTVNDEAMGVMADVAERLGEAGLTVTDRLDAIGVFVGRAEESDLPRIRGVRGVTAVEEERTVRLLTDDDRL